MSAERRTKPLDDESASALRDLILQHGARSLAQRLGVSREALERAALGVPVLAGTKSLLAAGLERLRATGGGQ
jgi:hypothetical protein